MQKLYLLFILCIAVFSSHALNAQELSDEEQKELQEKYYGNTTYMQAKRLLKAGKYLQATPLFHESVIQFEEAKNWEALYKSTESLVITYWGQDHFKDVYKIVEHVDNTIQKNAPQLIPECFDMYHWLGWVALDAGEYDDALIFAQQELELLAMVPPEKKATEKAGACNLMGAVLINQGHIDQAARYWHEAMDIIQNQPPEERSATLTAGLHSNLGNLYVARGNISKAIQQFEEGIELAKSSFGENATRLVSHYHLAANHYKEINEYERSIAYHQKIVYIIEQSGSEDQSLLHYDLPISLHQIGYNYYQLQQYDDARHYLKKALDNYGNSNVTNDEESNTLTLLGLINLDTRQYDQALVYFQQLDSLFKHKEEENALRLYHIDQYIHNLINLARFWNEKGEPDQALSLMQKALKLYEEHGAQLIKTPIYLYRNLTDHYMAIAEYDSALHYNQMAIEHSLANPIQSDTFNLPEAGQFLEHLSIAVLLEKYASIHYELAKQTDNEEKQKSLLKQGLAAIDLFDKNHLINLKKINILRGNQSKNLISQSTEPYRRGISLSQHYFQAFNTENAVEQAFHYTQKMKAQQLWLTLLNSNAAKYGNVPNELLEKEEELLVDIQHYEKKVLEAQTINDTTALQLYKNQYLLDAYRAYADLSRKMEAEYPEYFSSKYAFVPETGSSLQSTLQPNELLIEYVLVDSLLYTYTIAQNEPLQIQKTLLGPTIPNQIDTLNQILQNSAMHRKASRATFIRLSHQLYQQFVAPLENQLADKTRLIIIGDGMTNYIPFEALLSTPDLEDFRTLDFLIKKFEVSYHYSSSLFANARRNKLNLQAGLFAFAPVYSTDKINNASATRYLSHSLRAVSEDRRFSPLPESEKEVKAITKLFKQKSIGNTNLVLRKEATETSLKENLKNRYQFIHLAGHSFADLNNPKFSGIACFEEKDIVQNNTPKEDGILYSGEIYNIRTQADLVTLSSCESGYGKLEKTEGLMGLNRAFIYAGTPNVVFSLWKVYDKVSAELMVDFYKNILEGKDYAQSLRQAKLKLLNKERTASPHYWAPYLLIGR